MLGTVLLYSVRPYYEARHTNYLIAHAQLSVELL